LGDSSRAFTFLEKSLNTRRKVYQDEKHPDVAKSYRDLGDWYTDKKDYVQALESFQKSLVAIVLPFNDLRSNKNPNVRDCQLKTEVLTSFQKKGRTFASLYQRNKNIEYLIAALETYIAYCCT
jgi:tetratricopeptide (TPR) repeat protein